MQINRDGNLIYITTTGPNWGSGCSLNIDDMDKEHIDYLIQLLEGIKKEKYPNG